MGQDVGIVFLPCIIFVSFNSSSFFPSFYTDLRLVVGEFYDLFHIQTLVIPVVLYLSSLVF